MVYNQIRSCIYIYITRIYTYIIKFYIIGTLLVHANVIDNNTLSQNTIITYSSAYQMSMNPNTSLECTLW